MRTMFLAAVTTAALSGWSTTTHTLEAKTTAPAPAAQAPGASAQQANPSGIPSYLMRPDGLMTNGLLPSNRWQG
jgi:hypothetical protein